MANQDERVDSPAEAPTVEVGSAPDSFDQVLRRVVATSHSADLAPGTLIANRFRVEKIIGAGGMGTVYEAHDQTLARRVAVKLHHAPAGAVRLRREAVAMARLAHPNVVTVFEAGEHDGHPFVVMELVTGTTLRAWLAEKPRMVKEILAVMTEAGRGLAAAHDAGLLHRDIKPENVLVGADGRARVGDFGLARDVDSKEEPPLEGAARILSPMTQTGAVLGTPAYMAPEQLTNETIDARADQFAFCVTLWEALWKERPFQGANFDELSNALKTGRRKSPPSTPRVPAKVRAALEKGLSRARDDRFANMHGLLAALRVRDGRRLAIGGGAVLAAGLAAGGVWLAMRPPPPVSCEHAGAELEALIPHDLPDKLRAVGAKDAAAYVTTALDQFHVNVADAARAVCERRRDWSPALVAKANACLRTVARTGQQLLVFDHVTAEQAPEIVHRANLSVPEFYECTTPTTLAAAPALPAEPAQLDALIAALVDARVAEVEIGDGRGERVSAVVERLEKSPMRDWPTVKTRIALVHSKQAEDAGDRAKSVQLATEAYYAARASDDDEALGDALMMLLNIGTSTMDRTILQTWVRTAVADAERLATRSPSAAGALYVLLAHAADYAGDSKAALDFIARARGLLRANSEMARQIDGIEASVLMSSGDVDRGAQLFEKSIAGYSARLGADHPIVGSQYSEYAAALTNAGLYDKALAAAKRAVEIFEKSPASNDPSLDAARTNVAAALSWLDRSQEAAAALASLREHALAYHGPRSPELQKADRLYGTISTTLGEHARAQSMFKEALQIQLALEPGDHEEVAFRTLELANAYYKGGQLREAFEQGTASTELYAKHVPGSDALRRVLGFTAQVANARRDHAAALALTEQGLAIDAPGDDKGLVARLQVQRATALIATHRPAGARKLLDEARAVYEAEKATDVLQEIDRLLPEAR